MKDDLFQMAEIAVTLLKLSTVVDTFEIPKNKNSAIAFRLMANIAMGSSVLGKKDNKDVCSKELYEAVKKEIEFLELDIK